jgi:hypothetical protein
MQLLFLQKHIFYFQLKKKLESNIIFFTYLFIVTNRSYIFRPNFYLNNMYLSIDGYQTKAVLFMKINLKYIESIYRETIYQVVVSL